LGLPRKKDAPRQQVHDAAPRNFGQNVTILGALSCTGLEAVMTIEGATDPKPICVKARTRAALDQAPACAIGAHYRFRCARLV
jgi:hypothetical protein